MREIRTDDGPGAIEVSDIEMRRRLEHTGVHPDAVDAEAIASERAIEAALDFEPTTPDAGACDAATRNEMFTRANAR